MGVKERTLYWGSFWIFPLTAFLLLSMTLRAEPQSRGSDLVWLFPLGVLAWTLLEYVLHRFAFHIQVPLRNDLLRHIVNAQHVEHHASPRNPDMILVPPIYGLVLSSILYGVLYLLIRNSFSVAGLMAGIWAGFLYYEAVHYRVHLSLSASGLIAKQRRAHFYHHYTNNKKCFGVTSPVWDYVFRTALPAK